MKRQEMKQGVAIWRCANCRTAFFPQRLLCPRCHGDVLAEERVHEAVVEEVSTIRHMLGQADWQPRRIASVRTSDGTVRSGEEMIPSKFNRLTTGWSPVGGLRLLRPDPEKLGRSLTTSRS
jgi:uncharacterized OB-fold protein